MENSTKKITNGFLDSHYGAIRRLNHKKRSNRVIMTNEAHVLKSIREDRKQKFGDREFSLRAVAKKLGRTNSWLAQIENGRADIPKGEILEALLKVYGLKVKSFNERVRLYNKEVTPKGELFLLIDRMSDEHIQLLLSFSNSILIGLPPRSYNL